MIITVAALPNISKVTLPNCHAISCPASATVLFANGSLPVDYAVKGASDFWGYILTIQWVYLSSVHHVNHFGIFYGPFSSHFLKFPNKTS